MAKNVKIVRKDKVHSGYNGNLESVIIHDQSGDAVQSTNGVFVKVEGLMEGQREVKKATLTSTEDASGEVYLVHNSEVMADERLNKLEDYFIREGGVARAYSLTNGDIITLTEGLFNGEVAVGDKLSVGDNGLLVKVAEEADVKVEFTVIENSGNELHHKANAFAVQVERK